MLASLVALHNHVFFMAALVLNILLHFPLLGFVKLPDFKQAFRHIGVVDVKPQGGS